MFKWLLVLLSGIVFFASPAQIKAYKTLSLSSAYDVLFEKYGKEYGVDPEKLKRMAKCESTFRPNARNGIYGGMYQFSPSTWRSTRKSMGLDTNPNLRFNAEEAVKTTAFKISRGGLAAWPVCGKR